MVGTDVDNAINDVCLPTRSGRPGAGRTVGYYDTRSDAYYRAVDTRIANAHSSGGCQGLKNALRDIRSDLTFGRVFW